MLNKLFVLGLITIGTFSFVDASHSQWYWVSTPNNPMSGYFIERDTPHTVGYDVAEFRDDGIWTLVPDSFMGIFEDANESRMCSDELDNAISKLRNYDAKMVVQPSHDCRHECSPFFTTDGQNNTTEGRIELMQSLKSKAEDCLKKEQQEIEEGIKEEERKAALEQRSLDIEQAVKECDLDFFEEEMTDSERMATYDERKKCEEMDVAKAEPVEMKNVPELEPTQTQPVTTSPTPKQDINQTPSSPTYAAAESELNSSKDIDADAKQATTSTSTTEETMQVTKEELDLLVEQRVSEALEQTSPEPNPKAKEKTLFQTVFQFFFSWFN